MAMVLDSATRPRGIKPATSHVTLAKVSDIVGNYRPVKV